MNEADQQEQHYKWLLLVLGFGLLLIGAYFDNVRGPLLPLITKALGIDYGSTGLFLTVGNIAGLVITLALLPLLNRFNELTMCQAALLCGILLSVAGFLVQSYSALLILAAGIGGGTAFLGTMANITAVRSSSRMGPFRQLCALHAMYGLGSAIAAQSTSWVASWNWSWPWAMLVCLPISVLLLGQSFRMRSHTNQRHQDPEHQTATLGPVQLATLALFGCYVAAEVIASMWMASYLVEAKGWSVAAAGQGSSLFFAMMLVTRLLVIPLWRPGLTIPILWFSLISSTAMIALGISGWPWLLPFAGLVGPFFPLFLGRITTTYPDQWRAITIWVIVVMQITLGSMHLLTGMLTRSLSVGEAYYIPVVLFGMTTLGFGAFCLVEQRFAPTSVTGQSD